MAKVKRIVKIDEYSANIGGFEHSQILYYLNEYKELLEKLPLRIDDHYYANLENTIMVVEDFNKTSREFEEEFDDDMPF